MHGIPVKLVQEAQANLPVRTQAQTHSHTKRHAYMYGRACARRHTQLLLGLSQAATGGKKDPNS